MVEWTRREEDAEKTRWNMGTAVKAAACNRHIASGTAWHFGSNGFVGPRDEEGTVPERTVVISGPGPGPRAGAGVPSWSRGGTVVHGWMLRCVGLYGV